MMEIELEHGVTIGPSVQADIDYVEDNFRDGDRMEHESLGGGRTVLDAFERCWTIRIRGKIVGYCGVMLFPGDSILSARRVLCFMSCENANAAKVTFVRMSRAVMREIAARTPSWVTEFHSSPDSEYRGSLIWHERVLNMHRVGAIVYKGRELVHYTISRKEIIP